jgi:hypothetical protein
LRPTEEQKKRDQERKAKAEHMDRYREKLNEQEKAGEISRLNQPYYLQKDWLIERAGMLLGLIMAKRIGGPIPEPQLVIYPHEVAKLLKKTIRAAQYRLKKIREIRNIPPRMPVSMKAFCEHFGFDIEEVKKELTQ